MAVNRKHVISTLLVMGILLVFSGSKLGERYDYLLPRSRVQENRSTVLSMIFAGDIMAHDVNYTRKPYDPIYEGIRGPVWAADLSFANLEFVFDPGKEPSNYPHFNAPVDYVKAAIDGGFNVFSLANNHSFDLGRDSVLETLSVMDSLSKHHRIYYNGTVADTADRFNPVYFDVSGVRVGFLAVTSFLNKLLNDNYVNVVPYYEETAADELVEQIKNDSKNADIFILSYHGGGEYRREPVEWKQDLFYRFVHAGADIVWGHHTHVAQPWETVKTPMGKKLILYSTGNLISGQTWRAGPDKENEDRSGTGESALYTVGAVVNGGTVTIERVTAIPVFNHRDKKTGMVIKQFDTIDTLEIDADWELYYKNRLSDLTTRLFDSSSWDFVR